MKDDLKRVIIIGSGTSGTKIAEAALLHQNDKHMVVAMLPDKKTYTLEQKLRYVIDRHYMPTFLDKMIAKVGQQIVMSPSNTMKVLQQFDNSVELLLAEYDKICQCKSSASARVRKTVIGLVETAKELQI